MSDNPIPVKSEEVLITFLIANDVVGLIISGNDLHSNDLKSYIQNRQNYYETLDTEKLEAKVEDKDRLKRLTEHRWFLQTVPLKFVGTWPEVGDLPKNLGGLSVIDISQCLKNGRSNSRSEQKILSMTPYIAEILTLLPPILVMGGEIRDTNANQLLPFDADDGSHRCIAAALAGMKKVMCYVGLS